MKIKKLEKLIKKALSSLEENPSVIIQKKEMSTSTYYGYTFRPGTKLGREYCSKYYSESSHTNPYKLAYHIIDNLVEFLKAQSTTHE